MERHITFRDHETQIVNMSMLPKLTHMFNKILIKISVGLFADMGNIDYSKMHRKKQRNENT